MAKKVLRPRASGYGDAGASKIRRALKGFIARSVDANEDINDNNNTLRQRARMLYMSAPVATSAINTNRTKAVGTGLVLKSTIAADALGMDAEAAKQWQRKTEREFMLWAGKKENCDATGVNNFCALQQLAIKSWLINGDVFALIRRAEKTKHAPYTLRIHLLEADRVCTPMRDKSIVGGGGTEGKNKENGNSIYDGVEVDKDGMIVAYHICSRYPGSRSIEKTDWERVEAYGNRTGLPNILHIMQPERCEQYRGVSYLAQIIEPMVNLNRYSQSELMAALVQSFYTAWIETETDPTVLPFNEVGSGEEEYRSPDGEVSASENEYEMAPGTVIHLQPGEKIVFGNPNIPTSGYDAFFKATCKSLGAALEIPYDVLLKEFNASYSASRAAIMECWEAIKLRRQWLVDTLCQPIYEIWLCEAVASGRIVAPGFFIDPAKRAAWCGARWIGPVQGQLDPTKEVKADILAVSRGFKTHEQVAREYGGGDWNENIEQLRLENEALHLAAGRSAEDEMSAMNGKDDEDA